MNLPSTFEAVDLAHACRLLNHGPTVLVATAHGTQRNVMAAAWSMPVEFTPPRVAVVIDKQTHTRQLMAGAGAFALGIPGQSLADLCLAVGSCSGRDTDKFAHFAIEAAASPNLGQPLIHGCVAWLECRHLPERHTEVLWAAADTRVFSQGRWSFRDDNTLLHTLHHLGGGLFAMPARTVQARRL
jgi:hypothetical protein